ncbi:hypothetical protein GCM10023080_044150 [Streptomyces pseudoechinosporeus]
MRTHESEVMNTLNADDFGPNDSIFYQVTPVYRDATSTIPVRVKMAGALVRSNGRSQPVFDDGYITNTQGNTG